MIPKIFFRKRYPANATAAEITKHSLGNNGTSSVTFSYLCNAQGTTLNYFKENDFVRLVT
jgi:hypothetical protein